MDLPGFGSSWSWKRICGFYFCLYFLVDVGVISTHTMTKKKKNQIKISTHHDKKKSIKNLQTQSPHKNYILKYLCHKNQNQTKWNFELRSPAFCVLCQGERNQTTLECSTWAFFFREIDGTQTPAGIFWCCVSTPHCEAPVCWIRNPSAVHSNEQSKAGRDYPAKCSLKLFKYQLWDMS